MRPTVEFLENARRLPARFDSGFSLSYHVISLPSGLASRPAWKRVGERKPFAELLSYSARYERWRERKRAEQYVARGSLPPWHTGEDVEWILRDTPTERPVRTPDPKPRGAPRVPLHERKPFHECTERTQARRLVVRSLIVYHQVAGTKPEGMDDEYIAWLTADTPVLAPNELRQTRAELSTPSGKMLPYDQLENFEAKQRRRKQRMRIVTAIKEGKTLPNLTWEHVEFILHTTPDEYCAPGKNTNKWDARKRST